ncbi:MAG: hypothetical protein ACT6R6_18655, partial [Flavobacterium sp.]|uniref:hypothetical protein n=1 Tax=Flavobacterium sp. TaxID=239 RepID=UPI0040349D39
VIEEQAHGLRQTEKQVKALEQQLAAREQQLNDAQAAASRAATELDACSHSYQLKVMMLECC